MNNKALAIGVAGLVAWYAYKAFNSSQNIRFDSISGDGGFLMASLTSTTSEFTEGFMTSINEDLSPSLKVLAHIKGYEQFKSMPYYATPAERKAGKKTIGYGHLIKKGESFKTPMTLEQAESLFLKDVNTHIAQIYTKITVRLNQNQFDALCDFCFNAGAAALKVYFGLTDLINAGDFDAAGDRFMQYVTQDGEVLTGLYNRRASEMRMFKYGIYERVG